MEEEVNNVNNSKTKKNGSSGVGTFFFLVIVVAIIIASGICGILEYNYYMESQIDNLQAQIDELKKINVQMDENYRDAISVNADMEDDGVADITENTDTVETSTEAVNTATETTETASANEIANTVE